VGFRFVYRFFGTHGTYLLQPVAPLLSSNRPLRNGRTLVLVAHSDDETACAGLLQRLPDPIIAYATNGAPADEYFWGRYGSRENYARVRRNEAQAAVAKVGLSNVTFLSDHAMAGVEFWDQQLYRALPAAIDAVSDLVRRTQPDAVLVPAYEGGHPDHDSCSFLGALLRRRFGLSVWEMPLYHRSQTGELRCQQFRALNGTERSVLLSSKERQVRASMIASYVSQADVPDFVSSAVELYRPQPEYDYSQPPHPGAVNYEVWRWAISAAEVCHAFQNCAPELRNIQADHLARCPPGEPGNASVALEGL
jgi:LmbE family N-acetylglucosaminyl deacetylase